MVCGVFERRVSWCRVAARESKLSDNALRCKRAEGICFCWLGMLWVGCEVSAYQPAGSKFPVISKAPYAVARSPRPRPRVEHCSCGIPLFLVRMPLLDVLHAQ